jgi:Ca2+-binding EF-hand superfamily protein
VLDLFDSLNRFLRTNRRRLAEVFAEYDVDQSGALESAELAGVVKRLLPGCTAADVSYFQAGAYTRPLLSST